MPGEGALAMKLLSTKDRQALPGSWLFHQVLAGWLYLWGDDWKKKLRVKTKDPVQINA